MALQFRRGTEEERGQTGFIPAAGEPIYTTDTKRLYVGDGSTEGGNPVGFNNSLSDLNDVEIGYERIIRIISLSATNNELVISTASAHGLTTGDQIFLSSSSKPSLNGIYVIAVLGVTTLSVEVSVDDFTLVEDTGALKFEPIDRSILAYDQQSGKWTEQTYVYKLEDLGDVEITNPIADEIIQYTNIPIGDITDGEGNTVEASVDEPLELADGLIWTETGYRSKYINKAFEISVNNLTDVIINNSTLADNQVLTYDGLLELWTNRPYVDELTDLNDVALTALPDLTEVQSRVTLGGSWAELDRLDVRIAGVIYSHLVTEEEVQAVGLVAQTNAEFDALIIDTIGSAIADDINADNDCPVTASYASKVITLNPKAEQVNINLLVTVFQNDPGDGLTPSASQFEPVNKQVLSYDGQKWTNKPIEVNNFNLSDLNDIDLDNPQDGQILQYNASAEAWTNVDNFVSLTQFADVEISNPSEGKALIYNEEDEKFYTRSFVLDDLIDVKDPSFTQIIPDGSVLAYSETEQAWVPQQFTSLASRTEISFNTGPIENLQITTVDFEAFTGYAIFKVRASAPCTITLYVSDYEREADLDRPENINPDVGQGVFAELTPFDTTWRRIAPVIYGFNDDTPITRMAYAKVRNRSGYYQSNIQVDFVLLQIEEDPEQAASSD